MVPRRVPQVLADVQAPTFGGGQSGRLELARWLVRPEHPLTARVMVNRVWRWHFGQGLVPTPDNFGRLGERPANQPLLDWLTHRFIEEGWSLKKLHRRLMLSATYQLSTKHPQGSFDADPENRLHWRANVRRLESEAIRDGLLAVSGTLDLTKGGSMLHVRNREFLFDHTSKDTTKYDSKRRAVYLPVIRNNLYDVFQLFDSTDGAVASGDRTTTTVAPQALFLLNSALVNDASLALAKKLLAQADAKDAERVQTLYRLAYGRPANDRETTRALGLLADVEHALGEEQKDAAKRRLDAWAFVCQTVLCANEFIYID
jgi:hypothetical protein